MGKHTIYVRAEDAELWARAERYARAHRMPVSGLIMAALERFLGDEPAPPAGGYGPGLIQNGS